MKMKVTKEDILNYNLDIEEVNNMIEDMASVVYGKYPVMSMVKDFTKEYREFLQNRGQMNFQIYENFLEKFILDIPYIIGELKIARGDVRDKKNSVEIDKRYKYEELLAKKLGNKDERAFEANKNTLTESFVLEAYNRVVSKMGDEIDFLERAQSSVKAAINKRLSDRKGYPLN